MPHERRLDAIHPSAGISRAHLGLRSRVALTTRELAQDALADTRESQPGHAVPDLGCRSVRHRLARVDGCAGHSRLAHSGHLWRPLTSADTIRHRSIFTPGRYFQCRSPHEGNDQGGPTSNLAQGKVSSHFAWSAWRTAGAFRTVDARDKIQWSER